MIEVAILLMAIATYLCRASGFVLMDMSLDSPRIRHTLTHVPGSVLVAMIAPYVLNRGHWAVVGLFVTAIAQIVLRKPLVSLVLGLTAVILVRAYI